MKLILTLLVSISSTLHGQTPSAILEGASINLWIQAGLRDTSRLTDLAIQGQGFFMIENAQGISCFTRVGRFELSARGYLRSLDLDGDLVSIVDGKRLERISLSGAGRWNRGYLKSIRIDLDGVIQGFYSDGSSKRLGRLALALFQNARRLERLGEHCLQPTQASGSPFLDYAQTDGRGSIYASTLEEVDEEIYDLSLVKE